MNILDEIILNKRSEIDARKEAQPTSVIKDQALTKPLPPSFKEHFLAKGFGVISEVKRRSPSAGAIREPFDPIAIAHAYEKAGTQAISVLMDERYFGGGEQDFKTVRNAVSVPLLYKEFVVDPWQLWHARTLGASLVLLIAAALPQKTLAALMKEAIDAGLEVLFEVHDAEEMRVACSLGATIVGVNNRNLKTFVTDLSTSFKLREKAPENALFISESGIKKPEDVVRLYREGVDGILVGEHLLRQPDPGEALELLMSPCWQDL